MVDATRMAIDEINARGGLLGRKLQVYELDGRTDDATFARAARTLIEPDKVDVIFGCWSSACRKTLKPIVERHVNLLVYPVQYEGLERPRTLSISAPRRTSRSSRRSSGSSTTAGAASSWSAPTTFSRARQTRSSRTTCNALGGRVVGEGYVPLGREDFRTIARAIVRARPSVILNTVNGASNVGLFRALHDAGIEPGRTPVVSFSIAEAEVRQIGARRLAGNYAWHGWAAPSLGTRPEEERPCRLG